MVEYVKTPVEFIEAVTSTTSVDTLLGVMAQWLPSFLPVERGSIALLEPDGMLNVFATNGDKAIPVNLRLPQEGTHLGAALRKRSFSIANDLRERDETDSAMLVESGLMSSIVVPLISGEKIYGTLNAASPELGAFTEEHGRIASVMARWMASQLRISRQVEEITRLAHTDPLTGILNRRAFMENAAGMLDRARSEGGELAMLVVDLDFFKSINDTYGHSGGDAILREVVTRLRVHLRKSDLFARLGGEEFVLLLEDEDMASAAILAERLRKEVSDIVVIKDGAEIRCTASFGLACRRSQDQDVEGLMRRADLALYEAKRNGRNRVEAAAA